jgi:hypothetical protein
MLHTAVIASLLVVLPLDARAEGRIALLICNQAYAVYEGILRMQSSGRWAVCRPGRDPVEILSGELFRVEVDGELRLTRMEEVWGEGYFSVDLYPQRDGMRAAIGADESP